MKQIDLFYSDEPLDDEYSLMDVAYIYSWRRVSDWGAGLNTLAPFSARLSALPFLPVLRMSSIHVY